MKIYRSQGKRMQKSEKICQFCGASAILVAVLMADENMHVCEKCHGDPRIPTVTISK